MVQVVGHLLAIIKLKFKLCGEKNSKVKIGWSRSYPRKSLNL
jgi:hypothetical protein